MCMDLHGYRQLYFSVCLLLLLPRNVLVCFMFFTLLQACLFTEINSNRESVYLLVFDLSQLFVTFSKNNNEGFKRVETSPTEICFKSLQFESIRINIDDTDYILKEKKIIIKDDTPRSFY